MLKKCVFIVLVFCFVSGCISVSASDVSEVTMQQYEVLSDLGLLPESFNPSSARVSRGDFAQILIHLTNTHTIAENYRDDTVIKDVDESDELYSICKFVMNCRYMNMDNDGNFGVADTIGLDEAAIALSIVCGYSDIVENINSEYMYTKFYKDVFRNIKSEYLSAADIIHVIYNCIDYPILIPDGIEGGYYTYSPSDSVTILSHYHRIICKHGRFTASGDFSINSGTLTKNSVIIDNKLYRCRSDKTFYKFAGENVNFYYSISRNEVIAMESDGSGKRIVIKADDIVGIEGNKLIYEVNGREKALTINLKADFCYNGKYSDSITLAGLLIREGRLELVDYNSDKSFDTVMIWESKNYIVRKVDIDNKIIYDKFSMPPLDLKQAVDYRITDEFGYELELKEIMDDDLLTVYCSHDGELVNIWYSNSELEGVIDEMNAANSEMAVNGCVYDISADYAGFSDLELGDYGLALIDANGKIAYFKTIDKWCYGYIMAGSSKGGLENKKELLILTENGEKVAFGLNKTVEIDGVDKTLDDAYADLCNGGAKVKSALVRYYVAGGGISRIDTARHNPTESADSLKYMHKGYDENGVGVGDTLHYKSGVVSLGMKYPLSGSKLFLVPPGDFTSDMSAYSVVMPNEYMQHDHGYHVDIYNSQTGSHYGEASVIYTGGGGVYPNIEEGSTITVIQSIGQMIDENGDETYKIYALRDGKEEVYVVKHQELISNLAPIFPSSSEQVHSLKCGDIVWIYVGADNKIENIQLLYDIENDYLDGDGAIGENNFALSKRTKVYAYSEDNGNVLVTKTNPQTLHDNELLSGMVDYSLVDSHQANLYQIYKCTKIRGKRHVTLASVDDIKDYKNYPDSYSKIVINTRYGDAGQIVIYE